MKTSTKVILVGAGIAAVGLLAYGFLKRPDIEVPDVSAKGGAARRRGPVRPVSPPQNGSNTEKRESPKCGRPGKRRKGRQPLIPPAAAPARRKHSGQPLPPSRNWRLTCHLRRGGARLKRPRNQNERQIKKGASICSEPQAFAVYRSRMVHYKRVVLYFARDRNVFPYRLDGHRRWRICDLPVAAHFP